MATPRKLLAACLVPLLFAASAAHAVTTWNFFYSSLDITASGTFTTAGSGSTRMPLLSIGGSYADSFVTGSIDGLVQQGDNQIFNYDNLFSGKSPSFTTSGILFRVGSANINLFYNDGSDDVDISPDTPLGYLNIDDVNGDGSNTVQELVNFQVTKAGVVPPVSSVPEPTRWSLMLAAGLLAMVTRRRAWVALFGAGRARNAG